MSHDCSRKEILKNIKKVVIKIGSGILSSDDGGLDIPMFDKIARDVSLTKKNGCSPIIVSSGAIAAGMKKLGFLEKPKNIPQKQAAASVGQSTLMWCYEKSFSQYNEKVAQVLLTHDDLSNRKRYLNARNTLSTLVSYGIIPVINENDSVAVEEIKFGDNDNLSALITNLVEADLLIILTDIDGLYDKDPYKSKDACRISIVCEINDKIEKAAGGTQRPTGTGGMITKVQAARKASIFGLPTIVADGNDDGIIGKIIQGENVGTLFMPKKNRMTSRKHWIAFAIKPRGEIVVDLGAEKAIVDKGKSLLPSGIIEVNGKFDIGDSVRLVNLERFEFARGLANYSSAEVMRIKGLKTGEIEGKLGYKYYDEIIHRDDLVLTAVEAC